MTLDELKAFFLVDGAQYERSLPCRGAKGGWLEKARAKHECTSEMLALVSESERLQVENERLHDLVDGRHISVFKRAQERIHALEQAGASAFNAWRSHADIIGPMHVLREVVGAEFVDEQRKVAQAK